MLVLLFCWRYVVCKAHLVGAFCTLGEHEHEHEQGNARHAARLYLLVRVAWVHGNEFMNQGRLMHVHA